ncbi:hypothetical protein T492DRAFT_1125229 [Pavlovales sp. CCMP2436]|nr:hypothetical protein T492DRAFT_1125229 [Pavlovales sp. CCMP2436]
MFLGCGLNRTLSVCVCSKCGNTPVFLALFTAIAGHTWDGQGPDVHAFTAWGLSGVTISSRPPDIHVTVIRDPIERYTSAFHDKLLKLARYAPISRLRKRLDGLCLYIDDFALALRAVHDHGDQASLNNHFRPQQLSCPPVLRKSVVLRGKLSELEPVFAGLLGYEFPGGRIKLQHSVQIKAKPLHATLAGMSATARGVLCSLSRSEYSALNLSLPWECAF